MTEIFHRFLANKIMQKCYCHDTLVVGDILLSAEESHHLLHVVRVRNNEKIKSVSKKYNLTTGAVTKIKKRLIDFCKTFLRDDLKIESMADICS